MRDVLVIAEDDHRDLDLWVMGLFWDLVRMQSSVPLGIDLQARGHEVRKLLYAGFSGLMAAASYDPEEVLQEVYRGILTRNRGKCPWDPRKSTFGHYVHMVCTCILRNYHRKEQTRLTKIPCAHDDVDAVDGSLGDMSSPLAELRDFLLQQGGDLEEPALLCLPLMVEGWTQEQMAERTGLSKHVISRSVHWIRAQTAHWQELR